MTSRPRLALVAPGAVAAFDRGGTIDTPDTGAAAASGRDHARQGRWRFGAAELDDSTGRLTVAGQTHELDRSGHALLRCLLRNPGEIVLKETLMQAGWPGRVVSENSLAKAMSRLRQALNDHDGEVLGTVHGYGYRLGARAEFVADASVTPRPAAREAGPEADPQARRPRQTGPRRCFRLTSTRI